METIVLQRITVTELTSRGILVRHAAWQIAPKRPGRSRPIVKFTMIKER